MSGSADARRTPTGCGLPVAVASHLEAAGLDLAGVLAVSSYDALVPEAWQVARLLPRARSVVVLGCAGRSLESPLEASPEARTSRHPVDDFVRRIVNEAAERLSVDGHATRACFYWQSSPAHDARVPAAEGAEGFADFVALAAGAGLGADGRLRLLLHPRVGPWMAIRSILVTCLPLDPTPRRSGASPCLDCAAPCMSACPGGALDSGALDLALCLETRERVNACETACAARRACVIGPDHAYSTRWERHFMRSSRSIGR